MAPDDLSHTAADSAPTAAPANADPTPASEPADKKHGHRQQHQQQRGNRGGRDRGNDKQKRKHSGFGSAKYFPPFRLSRLALVRRSHNADTDRQGAEMSS